MPNPKVSIIVPIYNVEKYLRQCIDSVLSQTLHEIEIILVNDGSTDGSTEIIDSYSSIDKRIFIIHKKNGGYGSAVNAGLALARGHYIGIVESDDYVNPEMFEKLWETANNYESDIARGAYFMINSTYSTKKYIFNEEANNGCFNIDDSASFLLTPPAIWSAIYRKSFLTENNIEFISTPGASYQDVDFFIRTTTLANKIKCIDLALYYYRIDNPESSSNNRRKINEVFSIYDDLDIFINNLKPKDNILNFYNKRKICDLMWHLNRISLSNKYYFINLSSCFLKKISKNNISLILNRKQFLFYKCVTTMPIMYYFLACFNLFIPPSYYLELSMRNKLKFITSDYPKIIYNRIFL